VNVSASTTCRGSGCRKSVFPPLDDNRRRKRRLPDADDSATAACGPRCHRAVLFNLAPNLHADLCLAALLDDRRGRHARAANSPYLDGTAMGGPVRLTPDTRSDREGPPNEEALDPTEEPCRALAVVQMGTNGPAPSVPNWTSARSNRVPTTATFARHFGRGSVHLCDQFSLPSSAYVLWSTAPGWNAQQSGPTNCKITESDPRRPVSRLTRRLGRAMTVNAEDNVPRPRRRRHLGVHRFQQEQHYSIRFRSAPRVQPWKGQRIDVFFPVACPTHETFVRTSAPPRKLGFTATTSTTSATSATDPVAAVFVTKSILTRRRADPAGPDTGPDLLAPASPQRRNPGADA